ncbi:MAG: 50S ribosomal protein L30 [Ignavibacteriales bacterium CG07_land_8_20_14_0_80_59_12]|nr:MAG: 50S ribosomal protein L30 [Ignavibacteriales bacterium CG07_land_8_20_14_0_80_59_12]
MAEKKLKITQIRSVIDYDERQKRTIEALGLGRPNWSTVKPDTPQIRGMINAVRHLLKVEQIES